MPKPHASAQQGVTVARVDPVAPVPAATTRVHGVAAQLPQQRQTPGFQMGFQPFQPQPTNVLKFKPLNFNFSTTQKL